MNKNISEDKHFKHGLTEHPLYTIWSSMKGRCNPKNKRSEYWGGRGICVCNEWKEFLPFYNWSINNGYEKGLTIDRIDNDGNYEPLNCRWVNYSVQNKNKRKYQSMPRHDFY